MVRNGLAGLLVICWIILSGMDLLEDFKQLHEQAVLGSSSSADRSSSKGSVRSFANNIVESAHRIAEACPRFLVASDGIASSLTGFSFRAYFLRHKLYRVFLI